MFTTDHGRGLTIWVIHAIDRVNCEAAYSRVTPGQTAGTVEVACRERPGGGCTVSVTYDMSILPGADPGELDSYDEGPFREMLRHWRLHIVGRL